MSARGLCNRELGYARELLAAGDSPAMRSAARLQLHSALRYFWQEIAESYGLIHVGSFHSLAQLKSAIQGKLGQDHPVAELAQLAESPLIAELMRSCDPAAALQAASGISHKNTQKNIIKTTQDTEINTLMDVDFEKKVLHFLHEVIAEWREYSQEY